MAAAVPVMMFSGVLKTEMRHGVPVDQLFSNLNNTMHDSLDSRTFVCFAMGEMDLATRILRLANAAVLIRITTPGSARCISLHAGDNRILALTGVI